MAAKMLVRICLVCIVACFAAVQVHAFAGEPLGGGETHQVSSMLLPLQKTVALDVGMALHDFKRIVVRFFLQESVQFQQSKALQILDRLD